MKRSFAALALALLLCACSAKEELPQPAPDPAPAPAAQEQAELPVQEEAAQQPEQTQREPMTQQEQEIVEQIEGDTGVPAPDPEDYAAEELEPQRTQDGLVIEADLYTLTLPADWQGRFTAELTDNWLAIYDKESFDAGYGGLLCNIAWVEDPEIFDYLPDLQNLGTFSYEGAEYTLISDVPAEPQAPESGELLQAHLAMKQALPEIYKTIAFRDGIAYTPNE